MSVELWEDLIYSVLVLFSICIYYFSVVMVDITDQEIWFYMENLQDQQIHN